MKKNLINILIVVLSVLGIATSCETAPYLISDFETVEFGANSSSFNIYFSTNKDWTATVDQSWCKLSSYAGFGADKSVKYVTIFCTDNTGNNDRTCTVTIMAEDLSQTITIIQHPKGGFNINKTNIVLNDKSQSFDLEITASVKYNYIIDRSSREWIFPVTTKAVTHEVLTFEVTRNVSDRERVGAIEFYDSDNGELLDSVTITQNCSVQ